MSRGGRRANAGRKAGVPNKFTSDMKDIIREAFDKAGGVDYLVRQANENPNAFMSLVGRILPKEVDANVSGGVMINWALPKIPLDD